MIAYRTIEVDGTAVFYREGGDATARTLLLHGFPSSSAQSPSLMLDLLDDDQSNVSRDPREPAGGADTGHFATATHDQEIAEPIVGFIETHVTGEQVA